MKLLFVCTGNTCRSAMAQALAEKMIKDNGLDFEVDSAGLFADGHSPASENAKRAVEKYGATLDAAYAQSRFRSRQNICDDGRPLKAACTQPPRAFGKSGIVRPRRKRRSRPIRRR